MQTKDISESLTTLFAELVNGVTAKDGAFILNPGDAGLLQSLDKLSAEDASRSVQGGATVAAHARHVRYGLSLMNRWATEGGNPFADARWDEAWKTSRVDDGEWTEIRGGLHDETQHWLHAIGTPREVAAIELNGMVASVVHLAYHLGAIRQIAAGARGPREGASAARTT